MLILTIPQFFICRTFKLKIIWIIEINNVIGSTIAEIQKSRKMASITYWWIASENYAPQTTAIK